MELILVEIQRFQLGRKDFDKVPAGVLDAILPGEQGPFHVAALEVCKGPCVGTGCQQEAINGIWLGMEGSNLRFLIQSQASYHWTNPQLGGWRATE